MPSHVLRALVLDCPICALCLPPSVSSVRCTPRNSVQECGLAASSFVSHHLCCGVLTHTEVGDSPHPMQVDGRGVVRSVDVLVVSKVPSQDSPLKCLIRVPYFPMRFRYTPRHLVQVGRWPTELRLLLHRPTRRAGMQLDGHRGVPGLLHPPASNSFPVLLQELTDAGARTLLLGCRPQRRWQRRARRQLGAGERTTTAKDVNSQRVWAAVLWDGRQNRMGRFSKFLALSMVHRLR